MRERVVKPALKVELAAHLKTLHLPSVARDWEKTSVDAAKESLDYEEYLLRLCAREVADRDARSFTKRVSQARFPAKKTLAEFDFKALPGLDPLRVHRLAGGDFITQRANVLLVGSSGTGKTHLAISLGVEACRRRFNVRFYTVHVPTEFIQRFRGNSFADSDLIRSPIPI